MQKSRTPLAQELKATMAEAAIAQSSRAHTPPGMNEPTQHIRTPAVRSMIATLKSMSLPSFFDSDGRLRRTPVANPSAATASMSAGIVAASRVARAGAQIFILPDIREALSVGAKGVVALQSVPSEFRTIEAAPFGTVEIESEDDAPLVALPVQGASMDMRGAVTKGIRIELPRSAIQRVKAEQLVEEIGVALTLGLARAADEVLLSAIAAKARPTFSLGSAAVEGLQFGELAALVGRSGAGAAIDGSGALRVAGIPAELTADAADTFVGAWNRAGVVVSEEVSVHFERIGLHGGQAVTAWATMLPLVPDANKFWVFA